MAENGNKRKVYLVEDSTNTYVVGQTSGSFSLNDELLDVSDKTHEWAEYVSGKKSWSATVGVNLDNSASKKQINFLESLVAGTKVKVFIGVLEGDQQSDGMIGDALVASVEDTFDNGSVSSRSISLTGVGPITMVKPS
jgi:predicted secreted protein